MASAVLHIKDSYYFEVPKALLPCHYASKADFPTLWVQLDPQFQAWEAERLYDRFAELHPSVGPKHELLDEYQQWKHDHANAGKPFDKFLEQHERYREWFATSGKLSGGAQWKAAKEYAGGDDAVKEFKKDVTIEWSPEKIHAYNQHLSGKILIPQVFGGELRNFYEKESGFAISRFMIIEVAIALILWVVFAWLGRQVEGGARPRGRLWNLLEVFVVYIRDQVARPAIGSHDGDRFVPLLLTIFFFILGCNLAGMIPWVGAPTGSWGVTFGMACVTFGTVVGTAPPKGTSPSGTSAATVRRQPGAPVPGMAAGSDRPFHCAVPKPAATNEGSATPLSTAIAKVSPRWVAPVCVTCSTAPLLSGQPRPPRATSPSQTGLKTSKSSIAASTIEPPPVSVARNRNRTWCCSR